jgi:sporulation protein YabP
MIYYGGYMDIQNNNHSIKIVDRKSIVITGIKKIVNFDTNEFYLESNMGDIVIKGHDLEMIKLDTIDGEVSIKGNFDSLNYLVNSKDKESIITKLFK